jgi:hypothetical protein
MPRPIVLTDEIKQKALDDFNAMLNSIKMSDGRLNYSMSYTYEATDTVVWLTYTAYRKIMALVTGFNDEVGWHGTVLRSGDDYIIDDIYVYPQEVTGATVSTDQQDYNRWLFGLDDEVFDRLRMQGHSHARMGVSPSAVDTKHRQQLLDQLEPGMFYIFMVWNKSLAVHTLIYDMERNVLFEDDDIEVKLIDDDEMGGFIEDAKKKVQKQKPTSKKTNTKANTDTDTQIYNEIKRQLGLDEIDEADDDDYYDYRYKSRYGAYDCYDTGGNIWH